MGAAVKLFLVGDADHHLDLFVWAKSTHEAARQWAEYYQLPLPVVGTVWSVPPSPWRYAEEAGCVAWDRIPRTQVKVA